MPPHTVQFSAQLSEFSDDFLMGIETRTLSDLMWRQLLLVQPHHAARMNQHIDHDADGHESEYEYYAGQSPI